MRSVRSVGEIARLGSGIVRKSCFALAHIGTEYLAERFNKTHPEQKKCSVKFDLTVRFAPMPIVSELNRTLHRRILKQVPVRSVSWASDLRQKSSKE
jgi:hypothetical protein